MDRLANRVWLSAAVEATYGAGPPGGTWTGANVVHIPVRGDLPRHLVERHNIPRNIRSPHLGASDELPGPRVQEIEFEVELSASGTAGTPPLVAPLLRGCQFAQTIITGADARVEMTPVSDPGESLALRFWRDGLAYTMGGSRGNVSFSVLAQAIATARFKFRGRDWSAHVAPSLAPANAFAANPRPVIPRSDTAPIGLRLGCTLSAAGVVTGGTSTPSTGFTLDMGHTLQHDILIGREAIVVTEREPTGKIVLALSAAEEAQWRADMNAATDTTFGFAFGVTPGQRIAFFGRRFLRKEMQGVEMNRFLRADLDFSLTLSPTDPNDDFMRIIFS